MTTPYFSPVLLPLVLPTYDWKKLDSNAVSSAFGTDVNINKSNDLLQVASVLKNAGFINEAFYLYEKASRESGSASAAFEAMSNICLQADLIYSAKKYNQLSIGSDDKDTKNVKKISCYIPCYNGDRYVEQTLTSIYQQSYPLYEVIFVDDCSTDRTNEIAQKFPVRLIRHEVNKGLSASRNTALSNVAGDYIVAIDDDVVLDKFWLERLVGLLEQPNVVSVAGRLIERYNATVSDSWRKSMMAQHHGDQPADNVHVYGCNSLMIAEVFHKVGGYNEKYRIAFDDIDLSERLIKSGYKTHYLPDAVCFHNKKDSFNSILDSAYRWRLPPFEAQGVFEQNQLLSAKWLTETSASIAEIQDLSQKGFYWLTAPCYLGIFNSVLNDLIELARRDLNMLPALQAGVALLFKAVLSSDNTSPLVKQQLMERISAKVVKSKLMELELVQDIQGKIDINLEASKLLEQLKIPSTSLTPYLLVSLSELSNVVVFGPTVTAHIEEGLKLVLEDERTDFYNAPRRQVICLRKELMDQIQCQNLLTKLVEEADKKSVSYKIFFLDYGPWESRELIEELKTISPQKIIFLEDAEYFQALDNLKFTLNFVLPNTEISHEDITN